MSATVTRAGQLYDYAVDHPTFYLGDVCQAYEWSTSQCRRAVQALRRILGDDEINLVCFQEDFGQPKRYELVGTLEKAAPWVALRLRSLETQLETILSVARSLENATDGRTTAGKKARLIRLHVGRLLEDFAEMDGRFL